MFDGFDTNRVAEPRLSVRFEGDGTWSAWRGAILLASGLPTVVDAWDVIDRDVIDRAASARPVVPSIPRSADPVMKIAPLPTDGRARRRRFPHP
jgi:hypothetical protein